jgi:hypothetical protein
MTTRNFSLRSRSLALKNSVEEIFSSSQIINDEEYFSYTRFFGGREREKQGKVDGEMRKGEKNLLNANDLDSSLHSNKSIFCLSLLRVVNFNSSWLF